MNWFWRILLKGLATILPIAITVYALYWLGVSSERMLGNIIKQLLSEEAYWPGMGLVIAVSLVMLIGLLVDNRIGQFFLRQLHGLVTRIPVANSIYNSVRDLMQFFTASREKKGMNQVVEVDLGNDMRLIGFITQDSISPPLNNEAGDDLVGVYLPLSYQIGGFTVYMPRTRVRNIKMTVEEAMRVTLTAGMSGEN